MLSGCERCSRAMFLSARRGFDEKEDRIGVLRNDVGSGTTGDAGEERAEALGEESVGEGSSYSLLATTQVM